MAKSKTPPPTTKSRNNLAPAAIRALKEAQERRALASKNPPDIPVEINGRKGPEPIRYGDWEKNGIISDF